MKSAGLQGRIIMLIILLALLFNIERITVSQDNSMVMSSFVYLLGFTGALLPFAIPINSTAGSQILVAVIFALYFFCSWVLRLGHPLWGTATYLSVTELILLAAIVNLAQLVAREARVFLQQAKLFSITEQPSFAPNLMQERHKLEVEMARCRRYERNLGVILFEPEQPIHTNHQSEPELHPAISQSLMMRAISQILLRQVRRPDWLLNDLVNNRFIIVCPESNQKVLEIASSRLIATLHRQLNITVRHGYAAFPEDAVTSEALILIAQSRFQASISDDHSITHPLEKAIENTGG